MRQRVLGMEQPLAIESLNSLTLLLQRQGKLADMEVVFREHLQSLQARLQAEDAAMIETVGSLTGVLVNQGKWIEAEASAREGLTLRERKMPDDWRTFNFRSVLGGICAAQHKYADAEPLLLSGYQGMKERETEIPAFGESFYKASLQRLVQFYEATGRSDQAAEWIKKLAAFSQNKPTTNAVTGAK